MATDLIALCPNEYAAFRDSCLLSEDPEVFDSPADQREDDSYYIKLAADYLAYDGDEIAGAERVRDAWKALKTKFDSLTGLEVFIGFHDSESEGDRYDEVDGVYFAVDGMYELSEAGKKWDGVVERKSFVQLG